MLNISFDTNCTYRPHQLGMHIAKLLTDGKLPTTAKFISFQDQVVKNEDGTLDNSKHICLLHFLDDPDSACTDLPLLGRLAADLIKNEALVKDLKPDEGLAMLVDDNSKNYLSDNHIDQRLKVMHLDSEAFMQALHESQIAQTDIDRFQYSDKDGYFCIMHINTNGLKQFADNNLDYAKMCTEESTAAAIRFVKHYWPNDWQSISMSTELLDTKEVVHDERDDVARHVWKFRFRLYNKDRQEIKGEHAKSCSQNLSL